MSTQATQNTRVLYTRSAFIMTLTSLDRGAWPTILEVDARMIVSNVTFKLHELAVP